MTAVVDVINLKKRKDLNLVNTCLIYFQCITAYIEQTALTAFLCTHFLPSLFLIQTESRGGAHQKRGRQGQEGVHQAGVSQEEAAKTDGGHGHRHQTSASWWNPTEKRPPQVHPSRQHGLSQNPCQSCNR